MRDANGAIRKFRYEGCRSRCNIKGVKSRERGNREPQPRQRASESPDGACVVSLLYVPALLYLLPRSLRSSPYIDIPTFNSTNTYITQSELKPKVMVRVKNQSLIYGSDANNTEDGTGTHCVVGKVHMRLIQTMFLAIIAMAASRYAFEGMRNETQPILFRNSSKHVVTSTINVGESRDDNNNNNVNSNNETPQPTNWTAIHLAEKEKTKQNLGVLYDKLKHRFIPLDPKEEILNYKQLEEEFRPLLQERGMLIMGDSTSRMLFVILWCLLEGEFRSDVEMVEDRCVGRLVELQAKCSFSGPPCNVLANFTNETSPIHLQYVAQWVIEEMKGDVPDVYDVVRDNRDRFIFYLFPCLHQLWVPGAFEVHINTVYPACHPVPQYLFASFEKANITHSLLFGTTTAVCDSKLWTAPMIDMYLEGRKFVNRTPEAIVKMYVHDYWAPLAANYCGTLPVITSSRQDHQCDNFLFDDAGGLNCMAVCLEALAQHSLFNNNAAVKVLDIRGASEFGCEDTHDGLHYRHGLALRRQLMVLLRGMQSA